MDTSFKIVILYQQYLFLETQSVSRNSKVSWSKMKLIRKLNIEKQGNRNYGVHSA